MTADSTCVVVPLDGSKAAETAVPVAAWLAGLHGAVVVFVHVADESAAPAPKDVQRAQSIFAEYAGRLARRHAVADFRAEVLTGSPSVALLGFAANAKCIVLASHGRGGFHATFVGSVADKIVRGTLVPVFFVPAMEDSVLPGSRPVLVGLDGSPESERGLDMARVLARDADASIALVRAWRMPAQGTTEFTYYAPEIAGAARAEAEAYLSRVALPGEKTLAVEGEAARVVAEVAQQVDAGLVVVTSRGKGMGRRLLLGSTTDRLLHSLRRPLLIVPA